MNLTHIYQAWIQGNESYTIDWRSFAGFVSNITGNTVESIMLELPKYSWYKV